MAGVSRFHIGPIVFYHVAADNLLKIVSDRGFPSHLPFTVHWALLGPSTEWEGRPVPYWGKSDSRDRQFEDQSSQNGYNPSITTPGEIRGSRELETTCAQGRRNGISRNERTWEFLYSTHTRGCHGITRTPAHRSVPSTPKSSGLGCWPLPNSTRPTL